VARPYSCSKTTKQRLVDNSVVDSNGCWIWQKSKEKAGYGRMSIYDNGKKFTKMAHRVAYEEFVGDIPKELQLDHLCKITSCINPEHLEPVTCKENLHRSSLKEMWLEKKQITHCPQGHEYTETNTLIKKNKWGNDCRNCRKCHSERESRRYYNNKLEYA
jgi:hypothetical protein